MKNLISILLITLFTLPGMVMGEKRGLHRITLEARANTGERVPLYKESHALLVGISRYNNGWPHLDSIPGELDSVQEALEEKGFNVVRVSNPDSTQLKSAFRNFVNEYGYTDGARLLFYFAGHGHSDEKGRGFIVPADAPVPEIRREFLQKSLQMTQVMAWARQIDSDHALFIFDSCFSGTIFKSRNLPSPNERFIRKATSQPVRQFITAGSAGEEVPAESVFTPAFVDAITENKGDLNRDGYITGSALGLYLSQTLPNYVDQTPQYGKIKDYDLAQGDFVFFGRDTPVSTSVQAQNSQSTSNSSLDRDLANPGYVRGQDITDADRQLIWNRLNSLKWAIENKNIESINSVSDLPANKKKLLADLFRDYKKIDVELVQMSENKKEGAVYGHLRFKRFQRKDGSYTYPAKEYRENRVVTRRVQNGWTPLQW